MFFTKSLAAIATLAVATGSASAAPIEERALSFPQPPTLQLQSGTLPEVTFLETYSTYTKTVLDDLAKSPADLVFPETIAFLQSNLPRSLTKAVQSFNSLPKSSDPLATIIDQDGPLVKTVTNSVFYALIDIKLDGQAVPNPYQKQFTDFTQFLDTGFSYPLVLELNKRYEGFVESLASAVGENTALGKSLQTVGPKTFCLLFDHINC